MAPSNGSMRVLVVAAVFTVAAGTGGWTGETPRLPELRAPAIELTALDRSPEPAWSGAAATTFHPGSIAGLELPQRSSGFFRSHLAPRLDRQFGRMARYDGMPTQGGALGEFALFDAVTAEARHRASRGLRRALRDWALEVSPIGALAARVAGAAPSGFGGTRRGATSFGVETAHGLPVLELRHRHGSGLVRVGLAGYGAVRLDLSHARFVNARVNAEWDLGDDEVRVSCRFGF